jgi:hypothetical protein
MMKAVAKAPLRPLVLTPAGSASSPIFTAARRQSAQFGAEI